MALQKQQVPISFNGGIDTKTDDKQVQATKLLELENGIFSKKGSIQKRRGYDVLSTKILGSTSSISAATGISSFNTDQLVLFDGNSLNAYNESTQSWSNKGNVTSALTSNRSVIRDVYQQTDVDYAYNNGVSVYVWKDSSNGCRYSVIDEETGTIIQANQLLSSTAIKPRVIGLGRFIFVFYIDGTAIKFRTIPVSSPQTISTASDLTTDLNGTDKIYDAQLVGDRIFIGYNHDAMGGAVHLFYITASKLASAEVEIDSESATGGISIAGDQSQNIWMSWYNDTSVRYAIWDFNLDVTGMGAPTVLTATTIETVANVRNIASISTTDSVVTFLYEINNSNNNYIKKNTGNSSGTVGTPTVFSRAVGLASKFFSYNDQYYVTTAFQSDLQSTYFVYNLDGSVITKMNPQVGGGYTASSILPTAVQIADGKFIVPTLKKGIIETENGTAFTSLGINGASIDFNSLNNFITAELGQSLQVAGGLIQSYDGNSINESGFNMFPEGVTAQETNAGAGNVANGVYQYSIVYAWIDNSGQFHRSAPSIGLPITVASGPSKVTLTIPTLRITQKTNVFIEVYRTEASGTIFYKTSSNTSLTLNSTTADTITFVDNKADTSLISGEVLYTISGELDNIAPPSASALVTWKNRIALKSSEEDNLVLISKIRQEGFPVQYSDQLTISVDPRGGPITALGVMDDKLIIFKRSQIHIQAGDGPNNLGEQSDFGLPQLITSDAGCVDVNSVVTSPSGLMFKSEKGIYLLDRSLSVQYVGAEVEKFNRERITSAKLVPDTNQVRFTTESSLCLVYDYFYKQWSTFTNHEAEGAAVYQNVYCFVKSDGRVFKENSGSFMDGAQRIKLRIVTAWMNMSELQGYQRFYKLLILGSYKSKHRLRVQIGYNFNSAFTQSTEIDVAGAISPGVYGDGDYGSDALYGGEFPLYQWRVFPETQKCQSFRVCIEDIMDDVFGESFSISNMRMEIGVKQGSNKLATTRSAGTT